MLYKVIDSADTQPNAPQSPDHHMDIATITSVLQIVQWSRLSEGEYDLSETLTCADCLFWQRPGRRLSSTIIVCSSRVM